MGGTFSLPACLVLVITIILKYILIADLGSAGRTAAKSAPASSTKLRNLNQVTILGV